MLAKSETVALEISCQYDKQWYRYHLLDKNATSSQVHAQSMTLQQAVV